MSDQYVASPSGRRAAPTVRGIVPQMPSAPTVLIATIVDCLSVTVAFVSALAAILPLESAAVISRRSHAIIVHRTGGKPRDYTQLTHDGYVLSGDYTQLTQNHYVLS